MHKETQQVVLGASQVGRTFAFDAVFDTDASQEEVFEFFQDMSHKLHNDGYPILDDLRHEFPGIPWYQEILEEIEEQKLIDEQANNEEY